MFSSTDVNIRYELVEKETAADQSGEIMFTLSEYITCLYNINVSPSQTKHISSFEKQNVSFCFCDLRKLRNLYKIVYFHQPFPMQGFDV